MEASWFYFPRANGRRGSKLGVTKGGEVDAGVQAWSLPSRCLPALLPHALFLGHSFQFPVPLLIVESQSQGSQHQNRRKQALTER